MKPARTMFRVRSSPGKMGSVAHRAPPSPSHAQSQSVSQSQSQAQSQSASQPLAGPGCPGWLYVSLWRTLTTSVMVLAGMLLVLHAPGAPAAAAREASLALTSAAASLGLRLRVSIGVGGARGAHSGHTTERPRARLLLGEVAEALKLAQDPQNAQLQAQAQGQGQGEGEETGEGQLSQELQELLLLGGAQSSAQLGRQEKEERRRQKLERLRRKQQRQQMREQKERRRQEKERRAKAKFQSSSQSQAVNAPKEGTETLTQPNHSDSKIAQVVSNPLSHKSQDQVPASSQSQAAQAVSASQAGAQEAAAKPGASWIPGSRLGTAEAVGKFRARLACTSAEGRWVVDPTPRLLPWATDEGNFGHCDGRWTWTPGHLSHTAADEIFLKGLPAAQWDVRPNLKFVWRTNERKCGQKAQIQEFDGRRASRILLQGEAGKAPGQLPGQAGKTSEAGQGKNERVILLVGDSMQHSFAFSMYDNFRMGVGNAEEEIVPLVPTSLPCYVKGLAHRRMCWGAHFFAKSQPGLKMVFARNDFLSLRTAAHWTRDGKDFELPWITMLKSLVDGQYQWQEGGNILPPKRGKTEDLTSTRRSYRGNVLAPIVVLNRGMHYRNDSTFFPELKASMQAARAACPECILVFRNTPSGHKGCNSVDLPLRERMTEKDLPFNWHKIQDQTRAALTREIVESVGGVFLDVESMTSLRADGHTGKNRQGREDCTHYCAPGPVDFWTKLLFHALTDLLK